ncbi:unnamed protein product, partial [marine sediment metagenome]
TIWYAFYDEESILPKSGKERSYKGHIYVIKNKSNEFKIGLSKDIKERMKCFPDCELIAKYESMDTYKDEKELHSIFNDSRIRGEWFELTSGDLERISMFPYTNMVVPDEAHQTSPKVSPIPYNKPDIKTTDNKPYIITLPNHLDNQEFNDSWEEWIEHKKAKKKKMPDTTIKKQITFLSKYTLDEVKQIIDNSIQNDWAGLFELKNKGSSKKKTQADEVDEFIRSRT